MLLMSIACKDRTPKSCQQRSKHGYELPDDSTFTKNTIGFDWWAMRDSNLRPRHYSPSRENVLRLGLTGGR